MLDLARATRDSSMTTACDDTRVTLGSRHAHLWWIRPDTLTDPAELARCRALLTDDERAKVDRFRFARDRHVCLVTRVLVRATLSRYSDVPPDRWRFRTNDHGRPEIQSPSSTIHFNLSHTKGLIVCLVSLDREIGVDVESLDRASRWGDLAERFFAPREAAALQRLEASEGPTRFLEYWTLKESYIKARGLGLAIPLTGFSFDLPARAPDDIRIRFTPAGDDDATRWQFTLERFGDDHLVATAVERGGSEPVRIALHEAVVPLA